MAEYTMNLRLFEGDGAGAGAAAAGGTGAGDGGERRDGCPQGDNNQTRAELVNLSITRKPLGETMILKEPAGSQNRF